MKLPKKILNEILVRFAPLNLEKVILFGSYAWGEPTKDSDIDLYVVTKDEYMPKNFQEKSNVYIKIIDSIDDLQKRIPFDVIAHTRAMHIKFIELDSMFYRKLIRDGVSLL